MNTPNWKTEKAENGYVTKTAEVNGAKILIEYSVDWSASYKVTMKSGSVYGSANMALKNAEFAAVQIARQQVSKSINGATGKAFAIR